MKTEAIKLAELSSKTAQQVELTELLKVLIVSPLVQVIGTVVIAQSMQKAGILSPAMTGALEGGILAYVALEAYKQAGTVGAIGVGGGEVIGAVAKTGVTALIGNALKLLAG